MLTKIAARRWGSRRFALLDDEVLTFAELDSWADCIASDLAAHGVAWGDRVLIMSPNRLEILSAVGACWAVGAVAVPVVSIYRQHEVAAIIADAFPSAVVVQEHVSDRNLCAEVDSCLAAANCVPAVKYTCDPPTDVAGGWRVLPDRHTAAAVPVPAAPVTGESECLRLYTSGTTAQPKGARLSSAGVVASSRLYHDVYGLGERDVNLALAPVTHIAGMIAAFLVPLTCGASAVVMRRWDAATAVDLIDREKVTWTLGAAVFLTDLVAEYESRTQPVHVLPKFISGGANTSPDLVERADRLGIRAIRIYGMTETAGPAALASASEPLERRAYWDGMRVEGVEIQIVDDDGREAAPGVEGHIRLRGSRVMLGYSRAEDNEAYLAGGWFDPGDMGVVDEQGWVRITGRTKDIINRGGEKFSAADIELALERHPAIHRVAVIGVPHGRLGESVCAFVVPAPGTCEEDASGDKLAQFLLAQGVAKQKIPTEWHVVAYLPISATGKVQKNLLRSLRDSPAQ